MHDASRMPEADAKPTVSVIVPVYNALPHLGLTLDSILEQKYDNIEVVLVDDGSIDGSSEVCDKYSEIDPRIHVIHQNNQGVAVSRNNGIDYASGDYLLFVDADDIIHPRMIHDMIVSLSPADRLAICGYSAFKSAKPTGHGLFPSPEEPHTTIVSAEDALEDMLYERISTSSPWAKIFHKSLFRQLRFPQLRTAEDFAIMYRLYSGAPKVSVVDYPYYFYRVHDGSAIRSAYQSDRIEGLREAYAMVGFIQKHHPNVEIAAISRLFMEAVYILQNMTLANSFKNKSDYIACRQTLKTTRWRVLRDTSSKLRHRLYAAVSLVGAWPIALSGDLLRARQRLNLNH